MATKDDYTNTILTTGVIGPFINGSASITGVIETNGDSDWFKVSLTAGKVYEFLVDTGVPGASIGLRDEFGNDTANYHPYGPDGFFYSPTISGKYHVFANDDDEYSFRYTISVNTLQKENFIGGRTYVLNDVTSNYDFINVYSLNGTLVPIKENRGFYTFHPIKSGSYYSRFPVSYFPSYLDDFGDSFQTASLIQAPTSLVPVTIKGSYEYHGDKDVFSLTLVGGISYKFEVSLKGSPEGIHVFNTGERFLIDIRAENYSKSNFSFTAPNSAKYYLQLDSYTVGDSKKSAYELKMNTMNTINGNEYNDDIQGSVNEDVLYGNTGNDKLNGWESNDILVGGAGNDILSGGSGNDSLSGGNGNDILNGNSGDDTLEGGRHRDTLDVTYGNDTIIIRVGDSLKNRSDVVKGFDWQDSLQLMNHNIADDIYSVNGEDFGTIRSHNISNGLISFDDLYQYNSPLAITEKNITNVINYLEANIRGDSVAFVIDNNSYVFQDNYDKPDTLVKLLGFTANGISDTAMKGYIHLV